MTKRGRDFLEIFAGVFSDGELLPFVPIIWILIVGTAVWAIDPEGFEYLFPGAVFRSTDRAWRIPF